MTITSDSPADTDTIGTHLPIARLIEARIKLSCTGLNIGLEGRWGAGKSTVVRMLSKSLEQDRCYSLIVYDAWAHDSSSLRQTFLLEIARALKAANWCSHELVRDIQQKIETPADLGILQFSQHFHRLLQECLRPAERTLILVIDNLDRLHGERLSTVISSIWSFLSTEDSQFRRSSRFFSIIAYDPVVLTSALGAFLPTQDSPTAFLDKLFQVRYSVPLPITSTWMQYLSSTLQAAGFDFACSADLCELLSSGTLQQFAPTPRAIKTFVNRLAVLAEQWKEVIEPTLIAYFLLCELRDGRAPLEARLIQRKYPEPFTTGFFRNSCTDAFATLLYGQPLSVAQQLLLRDGIQEALKAGDSNRLSQLAQHGEPFWLAFETASLIALEAGTLKSLAPPTRAVAGANFSVSRNIQILPFVKKVWRSVRAHEEALHHAHVGLLLSTLEYLLRIHADPVFVNEYLIDIIRKPTISSDDSSYLLLGALELALRYIPMNAAGGVNSLFVSPDEFFRLVEQLNESDEVNHLFTRIEIPIGTMDLAEIVARHACSDSFARPSLLVNALVATPTTVDWPLLLRRLFAIASESTQSDIALSNVIRLLHHILRAVTFGMIESRDWQLPWDSVAATRQRFKNAGSHPRAHGRWITVLLDSAAVATLGISDVPPTDELLKTGTSQPDICSPIVDFFTDSRSNKTDADHNILKRMLEHPILAPLVLSRNPGLVDSDQKRIAVYESPELLQLLRSSSNWSPILMNCLDETVKKVGVAPLAQILDEILASGKVANCLFIAASSSFVDSAHGRAWLSRLLLSLPAREWDSVFANCGLCGFVSHQVERTPHRFQLGSRAWERIASVFQKDPDGSAAKEAISLFAIIDSTDKSCIDAATQLLKTNCQSSALARLGSNSRFLELVSVEAVLNDSRFFSALFVEVCATKNVVCIETIGKWLDNGIKRRPQVNQSRQREIAKEIESIEAAFRKKIDNAENDYTLVAALERTRNVLMGFRGDILSKRTL